LVNQKKHLRKRYLTIQGHTSCPKDTILRMVEAYGDPSTKFDCRESGLPIDSHHRHHKKGREGSLAQVRQHSKA
jgi:hypothetical protein